MKMFSLVYTGNDGSTIEHEYYGTLLALLNYITGLEGYGCHSFYATDSKRTVYCNGAAT